MSGVEITGRLSDIWEYMSGVEITGRLSSIGVYMSGVEITGRLSDIWVKFCLEIWTYKMYSHGNLCKHTESLTLEFKHMESSNLKF